jgi:polysaccharide biosynthesis protein PslH
LLYVSPVVPALSGNGLAMRAAHNLLALSRRYRVTLLVAGLYGSPACSAVTVLERGTNPARPRRGPLSLPFDVVHVFRLGTLPFAEPWLDRPGVVVWLDLDDIESRSARHLSAFFRARGEMNRAATEAARAETAAHAELAAMTRCRRVFVASPDDVPVLQGTGGAEVLALPNIVRLPDMPPLPSDRPRRLLFVGTLGYEPNVDGLRWFTAEVWPHLREATGRDLVLDIVGTGWLPGVAVIGRQDGVRVHGAVPEIAPWYARAHVAVVPILTGGGTRIKALEAFAYGRPVVGTAFGLGGLGIENGLHALIADEPDAFAAACLRLFDDPSPTATLVRNARDLVEQRHSPAALDRVVARLS